MPDARTSALADVAEDLYGEPLERFTDQRNRRAKQARDEGDRELADQIKRLPKPTVAAWLVNMLVRRHGDEVDQVLALGAELREAQENLAGEELRALDKQRRQLVTTVTSQARALARELGHKATDQVATQVEDTLRAAMADEAAATAVRSGVLVETLSPSGFGAVDLEGAVAVPGGLSGALSGGKAPRKTRAKARKPSANQEREEAQAREALSEAEEKLAQAEEGLREAQDTTQESRSAREQADDELRALREQVRAAERQLNQAKRDEQAALREQQRAERDADSAERAVRRAQARLDRLT